MGYTLVIGEHSNELIDEGTADAFVMVRAEDVQHDNAPAFDEPTDYLNSRWPSYSGWDDFAAYMGLYDVLYEGKTIRGSHPGFFDIDTEFKRRVDEAYTNHMKQCPDAVPEFTQRPRDYHLPRLLWLQYWTDWALENCKRPIMSNC